LSTERKRWDRLTGCELLVYHTETLYLGVSLHTKSERATRLKVNDCAKPGRHRSSVGQQPMNNFTVATGTSSDNEPAPVCLYDGASASPIMSHWTRRSPSLMPNSHRPPDTTSGVN